MISVKIDDLGLRAALKNAPRETRKMIKARLDYWGDKVISSIRRDNTLFTYKDRLTPAQGGQRKGLLKQSLYSERVKESGDVLEKGLGWRGGHGPIVEWGPQRDLWQIKPKGFRAVARVSRGGARYQQIQYLRFKAGGKIVYARSVWIRWRKSMLRPHYSKYAEHWQGMMLKDFARIPAKAVANV